MNRLFKNYRLPEHIEVLFMLILGILLQMTDGSPFTIKERWEIVWATELPSEHFSPFVEKGIKTVLSAIIAVRCVSTFIYAVSAMLVIFCILQDSAPKVMLLWLLISMIKSVFLTFIETLTGVYVCSAFGKIRKACLEFFVSKSLEIIFAVYMWACVLSIYQDMIRRAEGDKKDPLLEQLFKQKLEFRNHRARSLLDESTLYKTACLNSFEFRDVPQIILQMLKKEEEMSQDSLLGPGMMLASVSNLGSFDNIKTCQSLGELGMVDMKFVHVEDMEEDEALSPQEKALKFLKMTWSDVRKTKENKTDVEADVYQVDDDTWKRISSEEAHIHVPKHPRAEVFMREIPQVDPGDASEINKEKQRRKALDLKFGLSHFYREKERELEELEDDQSDEEEVYGPNVPRLTDSKTPSLFMSNIREEVPVNRIRLDFIPRTLKGNNCENLFKEKFMSEVGPEVFDRAPKLLRVTSLIRTTPKVGIRSSTSLPAFSKGNNKNEKKVPLDSGSVDKGDQQVSGPEESRSELVQTKEQVEAAAQEFPARTQPAKVEDAGRTLPEKNDFNFSKSFRKLDQWKAEDGGSTSGSNVKEENEFKPKRPNFDKQAISEEKSLEAIAGSSSFRKMKIKTKRTEEKNERNASEPLKDDSGSRRVDDQGGPATESDHFQDQQPPPKVEPHSSNSSRSSRKTDDPSLSSSNNKQLYFLTELLQKPLTDVLWSYYDLKSRVHVRRPTGDLLQRQSCLLGDRSLNKHDRIWKSKVLKAATIFQNPSFTSPREVDWREWLINQYYCLLTKKTSSSNFESVISEKVQVSMKLGVKDFKKSKTSADWASRSEEDFHVPETSYVERTSEDEHKPEKPKPPSKLPQDNKQPNPSGTTEHHTQDETFKTKSEKEPDEKNLATPGIMYYVPEENFPCTQESDESFSLYYSKAADLASPLLDTKRFVYPDHIHYSYKHVNKKGFDVDITGNLPLLFTMNTARDMKNVSARANPEFVITRRPMDLSFATTNAFAEWQNNDQNDADASASDAPDKPKSYLKKSPPNDQSSANSETVKEKKMKKIKRTRKVKSNNDENSPLGKKLNLQDGKFSGIKHAYSAKDYLLIEKLLRMHLLRKSTPPKSLDNPRTPIQISSTQLHSNKGRINPTYNPAVFLNENKTRSERRKVDTQEERTKDMFARLKREALLQNKTFHKTFELPSRK